MFPIVQAPDIDNKLGALLTKRASIIDRQLEPAVDDAFVAATVQGERSIIDYTRRFDSEVFAADSIHLSQEFVEDCVRSLTPDLRRAIDVAIANIAAVNKQILSTLSDWTIELAPGHVVGEKPKALGSALLWIPSRKAPLVSTAIMLCTAAATAGVGQIVVATPPLADGLPDRNTVAAAYLAGARQFVCGNGLAIIACASTGNWRHGRMDAIYGPGPQIIALAMHEGAKYGVATRPGVGPSDSLIIFDGFGDSDHFGRLARNFLTEIEHGADSFTYALTTDPEAAGQLQEALAATSSQQFGSSDHYFRIAATGHGAILLFPNIRDVVSFANRFAAEHLLINLSSADRQYVLDHAVSSELLDGPFTPFAAANYCIGVTAVLPTNGFARSYSGVTARDFVRFSTYARLEHSALLGLLPVVESLGKVERLPNHVEAVRRSAAYAPAPEPEPADLLA